MASLLRKMTKKTKTLPSWDMEFESHPPPEGLVYGLPSARLRNDSNFNLTQGEGNRLEDREQVVTPEILQERVESQDSSSEQLTSSKKHSTIDRHDSIKNESPMPERHSRIHRQDSFTIQPLSAHRHNSASLDQ